MMTNVDDRGKVPKETNASLNVKVHPDMMLSIANLVDERYSGEKGVVV